MKVVHLSTSDSGGAGIAASRLHKGLLDAGIQSSLLTLTKTSTDIPFHYGVRETYLNELQLLDKLKFGLKKFFYSVFPSSHPYYGRRDKFLRNRPDGYDLFSIPGSIFDLSLMNVVREADIVHLHWVSEGFMDYGTFFAKTEKKFAWTLHDMNPFTGGCHHADDCLGYRTSCSRCPQLKGAVKEDLSGDILQLKLSALKNIPAGNLKVVSPSSWMMNVSMQSRVFAPFEHVQISNPVDSSVYYPRDKKQAREKLGLPADKKIILFIAKDVGNRRKGFQYLAEVLKRTDINNNATICSVGNLGDKVFGQNHIPLGYVNDENRMAEIYSAADVFVLPSLAENLPNTLCEAVMCGTPVVAFDVGGVNSIINENNGILVSKGSVSELGEALITVISGRKYFYSDKISSEAAAKYAVNVVLEKYIGVYQKLAGT